MGQMEKMMEQMERMKQDARVATAPYTCIDEDNNVWGCEVCGHIERFEADGPYENGWAMCPACGASRAQEDGEA